MVLSVMFSCLLRGRSTDLQHNRFWWAAAKRQASISDIAFAYLALREQGSKD